MTRAFTILMAGGSGTRFWPLSRAARPKQLLPLAGGEKSLLAATVERASKLSALEDIWVVTSEKLAEATRADLPMLSPDRVLAEPVGRNTAPCIAWAVSRIAEIDPDARCAVLPADHHVEDEAAFVATLGRALAAAEGDTIVTVGIEPSRPETGYGYIEMGEAVADGVFHARRFVEKPNRQRAEQFVLGGGYLWNSGMFFFRAAAMLEAIRAHLPGLGAALGELKTADAAALERLYPTLPNVSIDHGVMEKVDGVRVVPGSFGWTDLGGFAAAWELASRDEDENVLPEGAVTIDAAGCYVRAPAGKVVALVGVENLVVVDTGDALLVVPRERAQDVKAVVEALKSRAADVI